MDPKGEEAILVGYSNKSKAYRLWLPGTRKIIKSRDVRFIENVNNNRIETVEIDLLQKVNIEDECETLNKIVDKDSEVDDSEELDNNLNSIIGETSESPETSDVEINHRSRGRPRIIRTGKPGRPKRQYYTANVAMDQLADDPETIKEILARPDKEKLVEAMTSEYNSLLECNTWKLVKRTKEMKVIRCKWVFHIKRHQNGEINKYKARLVARGCEQRYGIDYLDVYSPVARIRVFLALSVEMRYHVHQMDVTTAYIQGNLIEMIYMQQPPMFGDNENKVCQLSRPIYGLKPSGRAWQSKLKEKLEEIGLKESDIEPCVYTGKSGSCNIIIVVYVDDLLLASESLETLCKIKAKLSKIFKMKDLGAVSEILGMRVEREGDTGSIKISQKGYIEKVIEKFGLSECNPVSTPFISGVKLSKEMQPDTMEKRREMENKPYRELIGSLLYLSHTTRPDISFMIGALSRYNQNPGIEHWRCAKHVVKYLKKTIDYKIIYKKTGEPLRTFTDADWASDLDERRSCSGNIHILAGGSISWFSRKQASVALSTMEAEYIVLSEAVKETIHLRRLIREMYGNKYVQTPTPVMCDNQGTIILSKKNMLHQRSKHIDTRYHFVRDIQNKRLILVEYVPSDENSADVFTKPLAKEKHYHCVRLLNLVLS